MTGRYDIVLYNNKIHYHLLIKRNITILRGESASGKSEMIRLLASYNSSPTSSGITLVCDKKCYVLTEGNWTLLTEKYRDSIFFVDEGNGFIRTKEFADTVKRADNYFVIISREKLSQLPYSIDEVYGFREDDASGKYHTPRRVYNEMYRIFGKTPDPVRFPDLVITEDSNSGNDFFSLIFPDRCISSHGKSSIKRVIGQNTGRHILAVVDGAAFGAEMQDVMDLISYSDGKISVFAPESFEYLILQSGIIQVPKAVIEETWDYADSVNYFSWEEFYTRYLSDATRNEVSQYSKTRLSDYYKTAGNIDRIISVLPACIKDLIEGV